MMSPSLSPDYRRKWVELQLQYLLEHEVRSYDIWLIFLSLTESRLHSTHRVNLSYVKTWSCTWKCHSHVFNVPNTRNITDFPRCNQRSRLPSGNLHVLINAAQYDYEFSGNFVFTLVCPLLFVVSLRGGVEQVFSVQLCSISMLERMSNGLMFA